MVDLARALGYPYPRPRGSYLVDARDGTSTPLDPAALDTAGRTAVLAIGSNAAPEQLQRKWAGHDVDAMVPVVAVDLVDHDVVYAAAIAHYGSVPATLAASAGTRAKIHVTLLGPEQVELMDETEGVHVGAYERIEVVTALVDAPIALPLPVMAYVSGAGPFLVAGAPIAIAEIEGTGRRGNVRTQHAVLSLIAHAEGVGLDALIAAVVSDRAYRRAVAGRMRDGWPWASGPAG